MNRFLALLVAVATVALVGFGVVVFTSEGPRPPAPEGRAEQQVTRPEPSEAEAAVVAAPEAPAEMRPATPEAAERFDAWAKPLRDDGLTVTADRVAVSGETLSVAGLNIAGPSEVPGWRWTSERASLYDRELFHLQAAGQTEFVVTNGAEDQTVWSGKAEAIGIALRRDERDVLARSLVVRVNGLALAREGDADPITLRDGQLRILLKGGTGLLTPGTDVVLRLTDLALPSAAGSALGSKVKSFTTEFPIDQPITGYSLQQALNLVSQTSRSGLNLGGIALDWGSLHFIGSGNLGLGPGAVPRGQLDVRVADPITLLDSIAATGGMAPEAVADQQAAMLMEMGRNSDDGAVPMSVVLQDGGIVLRGPGGDIQLSNAARSVGGSLSPAPVAPPSQ